MAVNGTPVEESREGPSAPATPEKRSWVRVAVGCLLVLAVAAYFIWGRQHVTLENVKNLQHDVTGYYGEHPALVITAFFALYVAATGLNLPIASPLTLLAGAFFGRWVATLVVSFAATAGSTVGFLLSRFVLRGAVKARLGRRIEAFDRGIEREGAFYLFTLRLIPAVPFWMVNVGMGLTSIKTRTFWLVSQVGMLPGTFVYANAGTELGKLESWSGLLSPSLIISFAVLGAFPLIVRKLVTFFRGER